MNRSPFIFSLTKKSKRQRVLCSHSVSHCQAFKKIKINSTKAAVESLEQEGQTLHHCPQNLQTRLTEHIRKKKNKPFTCEHVAAKHKHVAQIPGLLKNLHNARKLSGTPKAKTEGFHTRQKKKCMGKTVSDIMLLRNNIDALRRT